MLPDPHARDARARMQAFGKQRRPLLRVLFHEGHFLREPKSLLFFGNVCFLMKMQKATKGVRFVEHSLINVTVPKNRKPRFELTLRIIDLNNVPLVSGSCYVKWHLPHSSAADDRGKTPRVGIKDHKVAWDYEKTLSLRLTVDRNGHLEATEIDFEIVQEYSGARAERITLGHVKLNLAEYVDGSYEQEEGITRRYLMMDSKINSTIKLSIYMKQTEGDRNFTAPQLRTAPIFGGIAGIMNSADKTEVEDGHIPAMSSKITRDISEMQDMYRRTLMASYVSEIQELPADECIEDIFSGGNGWGKLDRLSFQESFHANGYESDSPGSDHLAPPNFGRGHRHHLHHHHRRSSRNSFSKQKSSPQLGYSRGSPTSGRTSKAPDSQAQSSSSDDHKLRRRRRNEVSEFDVREDLRSWKISGG